MNQVCVLGITPGAITGIMKLVLLPVQHVGPHKVNESRSPMGIYTADSVQVFAGALEDVLGGLVLPALRDEHRHTVIAVDELAGVRLGGQRAGRDQAGRDTQWALNLVTNWADQHRVEVMRRNAGRVRSWATDERLSKAGLLVITEGMRDARNAARFALYAAVHDLGVADRQPSITTV